MSDKHLPSRNNLRQGHTAILLPLLDSLGRVDKDNKVVLLALVVHLDLRVVSAHVDGVELVCVSGVCV